MGEALRVAVVIASAGRAELLAEALRILAAQEGVLFQTVVSVPDEASLPADRSVLDGVTIVTGTRGAAAQRNAGIAVLDRPQVVAFIDDDSVLRFDWLANAEALFRARPDVVALTGRVLLDGAVSGEITHGQSAEAIDRSMTSPRQGRWKRTEELYGCNFAVRIDSVGDARFDERLPLYSWLEDHDLARRLLKIGTLAWAEDCVMVHRAASSGGRQAHVMLGYSQVMNPMYLHRKGSFPLSLAIDHLGRRVAKNAVLAVASSARRWRRERLLGNWIALRDVFAGRRTPERIESL